MATLRRWSGRSRGLSAPAAGCSSSSSPGIYDGRAADWLARHDPSDADNSVTSWRREHGGLHTGAAIKRALRARFEPAVEVSRPYLARMLARDDLEAVEHALTDAQMLPALGFWVISRQTA
jgi:hypothetical protein